MRPSSTGMKEAHSTAWMPAGIIRCGGVHDPKQGLLILDVDLTGLPASKHAEGSRKGYFSGKKRGVDAKSPASAPLSILKICLVSCTPAIKRRKKNLFEMIKHLEALLRFDDRHQRSYVLIRLDADFGNDQNINWLLHHSYQVLSKYKSRKRASLITSQVDKWHPLDERKWVFWYLCLTPLVLPYFIILLIDRQFSGQTVQLHQDYQFHLIGFLQISQLHQLFSRVR